MEDPMKIQSKIIAISLALAIFALPCFIQAATTTEKAATTTEKAAKTKEKIAAKKGYKEIHTAELKKLLDSKEPVILLDARSKVTVGVLPGAKHLSYSADADMIKQVLGSADKNVMIVVYCTRLECPLSQYLAENLVSKGYTNVYKYPEGIEEWMKTNPIDKIK